MRIPENADIWEFEDSSIRQELCYTKESIRHPAKMELNMCREIIKRYSKKGDLILDCMAGIGTTIVEGMLLGRNVIGVEYEQKFVDMAQANIDKTIKNCGFMKDFGKGKIIKGDSRQLRTVLKRFFEQESESLENGGLKTAASTEPFSNVLAGSSKDDTSKFTHGSAGKDYGDNPENVGNLKYEPLEKGGENIAVSNAPFSNVEPFRDKNFKINDKRVGDGASGESYSDNKSDEKQVANLPYKVDAISMSPPYAHESYTDRHMRQNPSPFVQRRQKEEGMGSMFNAMNYSDDPSNCDNLKDSTYLEAMKLIYAECFFVLRPGGFMILVTKNFVRGGQQVRLDLDTIKLCETSGFVFVTRHYRKIKSPSFWIINAIQKWEKKHPEQEHPYPLWEDVLVFRKEEPALERERGLTQSLSVLLSQTNYPKEPTQNDSEIKEIGEQMQNTVRTLRTLGISSIMFSPPFADRLADFSKFTPPHDSRENLNQKFHTSINVMCF